MRPPNVRNDPHRRERCVAAAIEVIAERGVSAVTARAVAEHADVPLGSVTYYFSSVSDLLVDAAGELMRARSETLDAWLAGSDSRTVIRKLAELVDHQLTVDRSTTVVAYELYVLGIRDDRFRNVGAASVFHLCRRLGEILPDSVAARLAATADGFQLQSLFETEQVSVSSIEALLEGVLPA